MELFDKERVMVDLKVASGRPHRRVVQHQMVCSVQPCEAPKATSTGDQHERLSWDAPVGWAPHHRFESTYAMKEDTPPLTSDLPRGIRHEGLACVVAGRLGLACAKAPHKSTPWTKAQHRRAGFSVPREILPASSQITLSHVRTATSGPDLDMWIANESSSMLCVIGQDVSITRAVLRRGMGSSRAGRASCLKHSGGQAQLAKAAWLA
ncbi:uncharacterized protein M421DRAFT_87959 [Didymella exigua CBS 183.55]|uniref:Uncharacterized protein n=1 Tax=Didymella exigua CBS 183.55 TaxID=1150837 RepID=A0A6A5S180_9PLEO|nr:uncharacterized protein M421DRAFT_87959 [Didymella exigua CBS 183.55]KAF1933882.1 hypothetical protein M421DRAFT_87959 [Didymella exigua CBS 183.55]